MAGGGLEVRGPDTGSVNTHSTVMRVYIRFCLTTSGSEFRGGGRLSDFHQKPVGASGNGKLKCECPSDGDLLCHFSVSLGTLFPPCHCHGFSTKHTQQKSRVTTLQGSLRPTQSSRRERKPENPKQTRNKPQAPGTEAQAFVCFPGHVSTCARLFPAPCRSLLPRDRVKCIGPLAEKADELNDTHSFPSTFTPLFPIR